MTDKEKPLSERTRELARKHAAMSRRPLTLQDTSDAWNERQRRLSSGMIAADLHIKASELAAIEKMQAILDANKDKEFVQRILMPQEDAPRLEFKGGHSTHSMAADIIDGRWIVYPTVVTINGQLTRLQVDEAQIHALDTGEFIDFGKNKELALNFSKHYKKTWDYRERMEKLRNR